MAEKEQDLKSTLKNEKIFNDSELTRDAMRHKGEVTERNDYISNNERKNENKEVFDNYCILVRKDHSDAVLEGTVKFDEQTGLTIFKEYGSDVDRVIDTNDFYNLSGYTKGGEQLEPLLSKDSFLATNGKLEVPIIKALEVAYGKDTLDKVLDGSDRIYLNKKMNKSNVHGKMENIDSVGGIAYLMDFLSKGYDVEKEIKVPTLDKKGNEIEGLYHIEKTIEHRAPILSRLNIEINEDTNGMHSRANLVQHNLLTGVNDTVEYRNELANSMNNVAIGKEKLNFLIDSIKTERNLPYQSFDNSFMRFITKGQEKDFDIANVITAFVSGLIIYARSNAHNGGISFKDSMRFGFTLYPPLASRDEQVGLARTAKGVASRKEFWENFKDYLDKCDNVELFKDYREKAVEKIVKPSELPPEVRQTDAEKPFVVHELTDDGHLETTVGDAKTQSEATVESKVDKDDNGDVKVEVENVKFETLNEKGEQVEAKIEVKPKDEKTETEVEKTDEKVEKTDNKTDKTEVKTEKKVEKKKAKVEKNFEHKNETNVERIQPTRTITIVKPNLKENDIISTTIEITNDVLESGELGEIIGSLKENGLEVKEITETKVENTTTKETDDKAEVNNNSDVENIDASEFVEENSSMENNFDEFSNIEIEEIIEQSNLENDYYEGQSDKENDEQPEHIDEEKDNTESNPFDDLDDVFIEEYPG